MTKKLQLHKRLAILTILIGIAGIVIVGYVDDDPILINPLLIFIGIIWYVVTIRRIKGHLK